MKPLLITLTGPSCNGKTTILRHLAEHFGIDTLVSTTTRAPRAGEVEGRDYYFISRAQSEQLERLGEFAELVTFRNTRYGVTRTEMANKLAGEKLSTLILVPQGVGMYAELCRQLGVLHFKVFVDAPLEVRLQRLRARLFDGIATQVLALNPVSELDRAREVPAAIAAAGAPHLDRIISTLTEESAWRTAHEWDLIVDGSQPVNLTAIHILNQAEQFQATH